MGGSVGFGGVTPHTERWVSQIPDTLMTGFKKPQRSAGDIAANARTGGFVWLTVAIWNLLSCDGLLPITGQGSILEAVIHGR